MAQLVRDASVFRTPTSGVVGEIRRAPKRDTVTDLMQVIQLAGSASDLIDKLGNNELAKMAAHGLAESRRKALLREKGVPTLDTAAPEREELVQEAIQKRMAGIPDVDLQEPGFLGQDAPQQTRSGLPGELMIPLPGQPATLGLGVGEPQAPQFGSTVLGQQVQSEALQAPQLPSQIPEGTTTSTGQLIPDPRLGQAVIDPIPVKDQHLPEPIQIKNLPQAITLARIHGHDPMKLAQILESVEQLEGLSPSGLFGLVRGEHFRRAEADIMKAAEQSHFIEAKLQALRAKVKAQVVALNQKTALGHARMIKIFTDIEQSEDRVALTRQNEKLAEVRTRLLEAKIPFVGQKKGKGLTIRLQTDRRREIFTGRGITSAQRRSEADLKETQRAAAVQSAKLEGGTKEIVDRILKRVRTKLKGTDLVRGAQAKVDTLKSTLSRALEIKGTDSGKRIRELFRKAGFPKIEALRRKKLMFAKASSVLGGLEKETAKFQKKLDSDMARLTEKIISVSAELTTVAKLDKALKARVKANKISAKRANQMAADLAKYQRTRDPELLTQLLKDFERHSIIRVEELEIGEDE